MLLTEIGVTLRKIIIFILKHNFKIFMRHPDGDVKKTVGVWDSAARFGLKVMNMEESIT